MTLFEKTRNMAKKRGYSLQTTAEKAGLSRNAIYNWKTKEPSIVSLKAVAEVLNVSTDYLLGNTDEMMPNNSKVPSNDDLEDSLNSAVAYGGKPMTENDRAILKGLLKGYFEAKEDNK